MGNIKIKLVVWDLDNTLWQGTLSEGDDVRLTPGIQKIVDTLDKRGILQSVSSKNNFDDAYKKLKQFQLDHYFLYAKINWNAKSKNISEIIRQINISPDTVAVVDDQAFELDEIRFSLPEVTLIDAADIGNILQMDCMNPTFITEDSAIRRKMYQSDIKRRMDEQKYLGTQEEFLETLGMKMRIIEAKEEDLKRAEELTVRTHQLNSTGYTYSHEELKRFIYDDEYRLWIVDLKDIYGTYGKIGLVLLHCEKSKWTLKLLLTSCRVMNRGIGTTILEMIINKALENRKELLAEFVLTDRNRIMFVTYSMLGFQVIEQHGTVQLLRYAMGKKYTISKYLDVQDMTETCKIPHCV